MGDADILKQLREQVLDESQPLVGLLRKCLALGTVTSSEELRTWATSELKGYPDDALVPEYRQLRAPLFVDTMSGYTHTTGQQIDRIQVPEEFRKFVPEKLHLKQPIQDLAEMASGGQTSVRMTGAGFSVFTTVWSSKLPEFQDVTDMYYSVLTSIGNHTSEKAKIAMTSFQTKTPCAWFTKRTPATPLTHRHRAPCGHCHQGDGRSADMKTAGVTSLTSANRAAAGGCTYPLPIRFDSTVSHH